MPAKKRKKVRKKTGKKGTSKRKGAKKSVKKKAVRRKGRAVKKVSAKKSKVPSSQVIGVVTHYFPHVQAAVVKLKKPLSLGEHILLKGKTTDFEQQVESMQIDRVPIEKAKKGDEIGLQVKARVREHDLVLLPG